MAPTGKNIHRMRILAADDDPVYLEALLAILQPDHYEVATARDGLEAWETYNCQTFSVVLCDWDMPRLSGLDLCRLVRRTPRPTYPYIILVTQKSGRNSYLEGMDAGADDFIAKPIDPELLRARLGVAKRILGLHTHVKTLEGMLNVCCYCKRIKENGSWTQMESFIAERSHASFSHCICEECYKTVEQTLTQGT
jgi:DNA-binding response OmpR family regulator